jgi:hypothetical protein
LAQREVERVILDLLHERKSPLSPEAAVSEIVALLKAYGVRSVIGDRYSEEFVRELFRSHGVGYRVSEQTKSDLYVELLPLLTSQRAELLDESRLVSQLLSLERRTGTSGKDAIDHPRGSLDDMANAVAGALVFASRGGNEMFADYAERAARERAEEAQLPDRCASCGGSDFLVTIERRRRCLRCNPPGPMLRDVFGTRW